MINRYEREIAKPVSEEQVGKPEPKTVNPAVNLFLATMAFAMAKFGEWREPKPVYAEEPFPKGKIVYSAPETPEVVGEGEGELYVADSEIFVADAEGKNVTQLTFNDFQDLHPQWSPDGKKIVWESCSEIECWINIMDANGENKRPFGMLFGDEDMHPDGKKIVYPQPFNNYKQTRLIERNLETGEERVLTESRPNVFIRYPDYSLDGKRLAYYEASYEIPSGITILTLETGERFPLRRGQYINDWYPRFSPDGRKLAVNSGNSLVIANLETGSFTEIFSADSILDRPSWSPDGRYLVTSGWLREGGGIFVVSADGAFVKRILSDAFSPDWEPVKEPEVDEGEVLAIFYISGFSDNSEIKRFDVLQKAIIDRIGPKNRDKVRNYLASPNGGYVDPETGEWVSSSYACEDSIKNNEEQGSAILASIVEYQRWHPNERVGLVGWSNGGSISLWIMEKLMENNMVVDGVKVNLDFIMSSDSPHEGVNRPLIANFFRLLKLAPPLNYPCKLAGADSPVAKEIISKAARNIILEGLNQRLVDRAKVDFHIQTYNVLNWEDCLYDALWCTTLTGANRINEHLLELLWRSRYSLSQRILGADWKDFDLPARWGDWGHGIALTDPASIDWMVGRILRHVPRGFIALAWFLAKYG